MESFDIEIEEHDELEGFWNHEEAAKVMPIRTPSKRERLIIETTQNIRRTLKEIA